MESNYLLNLTPIPNGVKNGRFEVTDKQAVLLGTITLNMLGEYVFISTPLRCLNQDQLSVIVGFINNLEEEQLKEAVNKLRI